LECVQIERRIEILRMLEKVAEILKLCMIIFKNTPLIGNLENVIEVSTVMPILIRAIAW